MADTRSAEEVDPHIAAFLDMTLSDPASTPEPSLMTSSHHGGSDGTIVASTSETTSPQSASAGDLPPLLALPLELKLEIFSYLRRSRTMLIVLRRIHPSFRMILLKYDRNIDGPYVYEMCRTSHQPQDKWLGLIVSLFRQRLKYAERFSRNKRTGIFPPGYYPCYFCRKVLPAERFTNKSLRGLKSIGGSMSHRRRCVRCALRAGHCKISTGQAFKMNGVPHTIHRCWAYVAKGIPIKSQKIFKCMGCHRDFESKERTGCTCIPEAFLHKSERKLESLENGDWLIAVHSLRNQAVIAGFYGFFWLPL